MYRLTHHAQRRIKKRRLRVEWLLAALDGRKRSLSDGTMLFCDPKSRCALVIRREQMLVVTAFRISESRFRKIFNRRKRWPSYGQPHPNL
jgi:hypothetical protein